MAKHNFKRRIYRVITATLQSCRLKNPSDLPINPLPSFSTPLINRRASSSSKTQTPEPKWHADVVPEICEPRRKICSSSEDESRKMKRVSNSSAETLVSSSILSLFSTDSSAERIKRRRRTRRRRRRRVLKLTTKRQPVAGIEVPARLSVFKKMIACTVDGKVKGSFAIVKRSHDPYQDFKESMMDMILEKQMFDRKDLEQLLECFLSLNSRRYHGIIVRAFSEIWEAIFSSS